MADNSKQVQFKLNGDNSNVLASMQEVSKGFKSLGSDIKSQLSGIQGTLGNLSAPVKAITAGFAAVGTAIAAVAGAVTASIYKTNEFVLSVNALHLALGVSLKDATTWAIASKEMGIETSDLTNIAAKLETRVLKNSEVFEKWGVATKDASGHMLNSTDILENLATKYNTLGTQQEKNALLATTLGRSWITVQPIMVDLANKLNHARGIQEEFNLTVSAKGVAASKAFGVSMADVGFAFQGVAKVVSDAFMPTVTDCINAFTELISDVLPAFQWGVRAVAEVINVVIAVFKELGSIAAGTFDVIVDGVNLVLNVVTKVLAGDFKGAWAAGKAGAKELTDDIKAYYQQCVDASQQYADRHRAVWEQVAADDKRAEKTGKAGALPAGLEGGGPGIMEVLKQKLEVYRKSRADQLGIDQDYYQLSKAEEYKWWEDALTKTKASSKERLQIEAEVNSSRKAMKEEAFAQQKAQLATQLANLKDDYAAQLRLAEANEASIGKIEGTQSVHYQEAAKEVAEIKNKQLAQTKKINEEIAASEAEHTQALGTMQKEALAFRKSQAQISEQEYLAQTIQAGNAEYSEARKALAERLTLAKGDLVEQQKIRGDQQKLEDKHLQDEQKNQQQLSLLSGTAGDGWLAGLRATANALPSIYQQFSSFSKSVASSIENGIGKALTDLVTTSKGLTNVVSSLFRSLATSVIGSFAQMEAKYVVDMAIKQTMGTTDAALAAKQKADSAAQTIAESSKTAAVATGATTTAAAMAATTTAYDLATASAIDLAAAETWAAYAAMPFVGPGLAVAQVNTMEAALAQVKAYATTFSAFATGGLVTSPTLGLVGEAGPEVIAPVKDFKSVAAGLINDVVGTMSRSNKYSSNSSKLASVSNSGQGNGDHYHTHLEGAIIAGSNLQSASIIGNMVNRGTNNYNMKHG